MHVMSENVGRPKPRRAMRWRDEHPRLKKRLGKIKRYIAHRTPWAWVVIAGAAAIFVLFMTAAFVYLPIR